MRHLVGCFAMLLLGGCMVSGVSLSLAPDGPPVANVTSPAVRYEANERGGLTFEERDFSLEFGGNIAPDRATQLRGDLWLSLENRSDQPISLHWKGAMVKTATGEHQLYFTSPDTRAMVGPPQGASVVPPRTRGFWSVGTGPPGEPGRASGSGEFAHYEAWLPTLGSIFVQPASSRPGDLEAAGRKAVGTRLLMTVPLTVRGERIDYVLPAVVNSFKTHRQRLVF